MKPDPVMPELRDMRLAAIQMVSTPDVDENIACARRLLEESASQGAQLALLPEYWPLFGRSETDKLHHAEPMGSGKMQEAMAQAARELGLWLIGGTIPLASADPAKVLNTTLVYDPRGECVARYDKMHLFGFSRGEESYDEGRTIASGDAVAHVDVPCGRVGLSVCYDLRFPELYRALGTCALIVVPSAFTATTGRAHWEVLLRARAVENQCYVLAAAQGGKHLNGRQTWGHSMLIDPWGEVLQVLPEGEGLVLGDLRQARLQEVRQSLPALAHRRL